MPQLVSKPEDINADWLTETLNEIGLLSGQRVASVESKTIGTGKMGDNVRYRVTYDRPDPRLPQSFVAKLPAAEPVARNSSAAQGSYWREVQFYQEVAPKIPMRTPRAYVAMVADNRSDYVILMEDMTPAAPGDQITGCDPSVAEIALREAAKLHGPLTGSAAIEAAEWVVKTTDDGATFGQMMLKTMWPGFVERFASAISPETNAIAERFIDSFASFATSYDGPRTMIHADYRLENMLFGNQDGGPPVAVVDWQSCSHGCGVFDVAYFVGGGLRLAERRAHERELVELYRGELHSNGVALTSEQCWEQYRRGSLHGIFITVIGAMLSGQDDRGDQMFRAMIERHGQHAIDMEAGDFL